MPGLILADWPRWLRDWLPLIVLMGLIYWLSDQSRLVEIENEIGEKSFFKGAHITAYALLMWLWWRALAPTRHATWGVLGTAFGLSVLYGISDEVHQSFVPGRHATVADVLFDASGALLMVIVLRCWPWLRRFPEGQPSKESGGTVDGTDNG